MEFLLQERRFFIATHRNPEGDALGSSLALSMALESMGKDTVVYDLDPVPELYRFLPGSDKFTTSSESLKKDRLPLVLLDCNEPERAGLESVIATPSAVIDHHETLREFGDIKWVEPGAAATGMMVYHLVKQLGVDITKAMATNLYTAIAIDTGTFRYNNTTPEVLRIAADLADLGADSAAISEALYESWSGGRFRLLIDVLNTVEVLGDFVITVATREMFLKTGTSGADTENFPNFPGMMRDIKVSAFLREVEGGWKVSLRSKGNINVARLAAQFQGGGHRNAAGYTARTDLKKAKDELIKAISGLNRSKVKEVK
ncbi:MAG TPA: bifunctional oligoribonuclease/PAP phosphatase NrnA [Thermodesulfovibrionales bacterium]|nr:bifunctional oligoribonuclease/PAP phosphatase NrnA [Thermodesulfovibrionales bacterium]